MDENQLLAFISTLVKWHDPYANSHSDNVVTFVVALAEAIDYPKDKMSMLRLAASLHDIGKLIIPEATLNKANKLTREEMEAIHRHAVIGYEAVKNLGYPHFVADAILQHHENWDGTGYPNGLKGEHIIQEARIIRIADVFDSLTSKRAYRPPLAFEDAVRMLDDDRNVFDPVLLEVFVRHVLKA